MCAVNVKEKICAAVFILSSISHKLKQYREENGNKKKES